MSENLPTLKGTMLREACWCIAAFAFAGASEWVAGRISGDWYYIINRLLHHTVKIIDDQPLWGMVLQDTVEYSPIIAFIGVLIWGVRKRRWYIAIAFFLGIVAVNAYWWYTFLDSMRHWD